MSSNLDNDFSVLIAELLRNELLSQSRSTRRNARRQRHYTPATTTPETTTPDTTRRRLMDVITEYNGIIGHYNRNMEMLFGLLNDEMTHNRNVETSPPVIDTTARNETLSRNSTSSRHARRHANTIHRETYNDTDTTQQYEDEPENTNTNTNTNDVSGNIYNNLFETYSTENPYASSLLSLTNLSRLWGRPRHTSNISRDYMLYINTMPLYSQETDTAIRGLTPQEIESTTTELIYNDISSNMISTQCPISFDDFRNGERVLQIRDCGHIFKPDELRRWLTRHQNCPVCRYDLRTNIGRPPNTTSFTDEWSESDDELPDLL
jgi:hypothetical protein